MNLVQVVTQKGKSRSNFGVITNRKKYLTTLNLQSGMLGVAKAAINFI